MAAPASAGATLLLSVSPPVPTAGGPVAITAKGVAEENGTVAFFQPVASECARKAPIAPAGATPEQLAFDKPWFSAPVTGGSPFEVTAVAGEGNQLSTSPGIYIVCAYLEGEGGRTDAGASLEYRIGAPSFPAIVATFAAAPQNPLRSGRLRVSAHCNEACETTVKASLVAGGRARALAAVTALMGSGHFGLDPSSAVIELRLPARAGALIRAALRGHRHAQIRLQCVARGEGEGGGSTSRALILPAG
jgi:hypothetical protein